MTQIEYLRERDRNAENLQYTKITPDETAHMEGAAARRVGRLLEQATRDMEVVRATETEDAARNSIIPRGRVCPIAPASSNLAKTSKPVPKVKRIEIYRGPPDGIFPGGWPQGWTQVVLQRQSGATSGSKDRYWFSPGGRKFNSKVQVEKFMIALAKSQGNESKAFAFFKQVSI